MCAGDLLKKPGETGKGVGEAGQGRGGSPARVESQAQFSRVVSAWSHGVSL